MSCCCLGTVSTGEVAIVQRMGKFSRLAEVSFRGCLMYMKYVLFAFWGWIVNFIYVLFTSVGGNV
jgi:hypothetical protein